MKKILINILIILLSNFLLAQGFVTNVSKRGTTAAPFLSISQGVRASGMGSAFVSVSEDVSTIYWNPAGISKIQGGSVLFEYTSWIADINYSYFAGAYNLGNIGTIGLSFIASNVPEINVTTINEPEGTGETYQVSDMAVSIAYAINLTDNFAIGFNPKFIYQKIWRTSATGFAIDLGVQYVTPFDGAVLGMSISNFGTKMKLDGTSTLVLYDPDPNTTGNNDRIPAYLQTEEWELPLNFRVGIAYKPIKSEHHSVLIAVDAMHPSDNYESVNAGLEYTFNNFLSIRGGYKSLFLSDSEESFSFGFGIKQFLMGNVAFKIDYAYGDFGRFDNIQKFSIGVNF